MSLLNFTPRPVWPRLLLRSPIILYRRHALVGYLKITLGTVIVNLDWLKAASRPGIVPKLNGKATVET